MLNPKGIVDWKDYKYILLLYIGILITMPLAMSTFFYYLKSRFANDSVSDENLAKFIVISIGLLGLLLIYTFFNLTFKVIRGLILRGSKKH